MRRPGPLRPAFKPMACSTAPARSGACAYSHPDFLNRQYNKPQTPLMTPSASG
jgi:hypothetical protein